MIIRERVLFLSMYLLSLFNNPSSRNFALVDSLSCTNNATSPSSSAIEDNFSSTRLSDFTIICRTHRLNIFIIASRVKSHNPNRLLRRQIKLYFTGSRINNHYPTATGFFAKFFIQNINLLLNIFYHLLQTRCNLL